MDSTTPTNNNYIIAGAIIVAGILISLGIFASKSPVNLPGTGDTAGDPTQIISEADIDIPAVSASDHIRGASDAQVTLVEYSDIQCPFCQRFHAEAKAAFASYTGNQFAWVYRHFPLTSIHPHATRYAVATECVAQQKGSAGFATFIDELIVKAEAAAENQNGVSQADIVALAQSQGLDTTAFTSCLASDAPAKIVSQQSADAQKAGGTGTPYNIFVSKTALTDAQKSAIETAFPQPGLFLISKDGKKLSIAGSISQDQIKQLVDIMMTK